MPICEPTSDIDVATLQFVVYTKLCHKFIEFGKRGQSPATTHFFFGDVRSPGSGLRYLFNVSCCGMNDNQKEAMRKARANLLLKVVSDNYSPSRGAALGNCAEAINTPLYVFIHA